MIRILDVFSGPPWINLFVASISHQPLCFVEGSQFSAADVARFPFVNADLVKLAWCQRSSSKAKLGFEDKEFQELQRSGSWC